ncbi:MAG: hypothetical protein ABIS03_05530 [Gemmatimonadaceae bacterium]
MTDYAKVSKLDSAFIGYHARRAMALLLATSMLVQSACFSYRPAVASGLLAGSSVQFELTQEGRQHLEPLLGAPTRSLTGEVQELVADSVAVVLIDELLTVNGESVTWRRGRLPIQLADVASIHERTLNKRKSWTVVAVAAAVFTGVIIAAIRHAGSSGSSKRGGGGGPPE